MSFLFLINLILYLLLINKIYERRTGNKNYFLIIISILIITLVYSINKELNILFYFYLIPFIYIFYIDKKELIIFDEYNLLLLILSLIFTIFYKQLIPSIYYLIFFILLYFLVLIIQNKTKKEYIGLGDMKLFVSLSLIFTYYTFYVMFLSSVSALIITIVKQLITKRKCLIPFGPYLVVSYLMIFIIYIK